LPTLAIFDGIKIAMYYADHEPAHFHAIAGDDEVVIGISDLRAIAGSLPPAMVRRVRGWARRHQAELLCWSDAGPDRSQERLTDETADHPDCGAASAEPHQARVE
jgi:hypothetical protein